MRIQPSTFARGSIGLVSRIRMRSESHRIRLELVRHGLENKVGPTSWTSWIAITSVWMYPKTRKLHSTFMFRTIRGSRERWTGDGPNLGPFVWKKKKETKWLELHLSAQAFTNAPSNALYIWKLDYVKKNLLLWLKSSKLPVYLATFLTFELLVFHESASFVQPKRSMCDEDWD